MFSTCHTPVRKTKSITKGLFSTMWNASAICKAIFHFWEMPAQFAKPFFIFAKRQRNLQSHFSFLQNVSAICKSIFHFCKTPAQFAKAFFIFEKCQRNLQKQKNPQFDVDATKLRIEQLWLLFLRNQERGLFLVAALVLGYEFLLYITGN